jgi:hypothetical protein
MTTINQFRAATLGGKVKPIKGVDTKGLKRLNDLSIARGYNRNLSDEFFEEADPRGTHILSVLMIHEHAWMRPVAPHYRCMVLAKLRHCRRPTFVVLDLPMSAFDSLRDAVA